MGKNQLRKESFQEGTHYISAQTLGEAVWVSGEGKQHAAKGSKSDGENSPRAGQSQVPERVHLATLTGQPEGHTPGNMQVADDRDSREN